MPNGQNDSKRSHDQFQANHNGVTKPWQRHTRGPNELVAQSQTQGCPLVDQSDQGHGQRDDDLTYYPAYCHKASPTWFEWVKLTAHDIHTKLQIRDGYQHAWLTEHRFARDAPLLMFYLNHPIQFVQVVGVVVSFDEYFDRFWLFTIDDSSGNTIDVVCRKPTKDRAEKIVGSISTFNDKREDEKEEEKEILQLSSLVISAVELGSVLQVKGVVTLFRRSGLGGGNNDLKSNALLNHTPREEPVRQISLQRLTRLYDTNQEIGLIAARTHFYRSVLSRPWVLSRKELEKLHKEALGEIEHDKKRAKKTVRKRQKIIETEKEDAMTIQREYEKEEQERQRDAEVAREAGRRLKEGSEREGIQLTDLVAPRANRLLADVRPKEEGRRPGQNAPLARRVSAIPVPEQADTTNDSFGPLEDEKSALLRLAFG